jgi:hypothetical protein
MSCNCVWADLPSKFFLFFYKSKRSALDVQDVSLHIPICSFADLGKSRWNKFPMADLHMKRLIDNMPWSYSTYPLTCGKAVYKFMFYVMKVKDSHLEIRRMTLVRTDVSEERISSIIRVTRINKLAATLVTANIAPISPILVTLMIQEISSFETLVLTGATRRHIPENSIIHSHRSENLSSYLAQTGWTL